jgi:CRP-like cAMP-binding protein
MSDKHDMVEELGKHPFMEGLSPDLVEKMTRFVKGIKTWDSDEVIFRSGGAADECFLIRSGEVALEVHSPGSGSRIIQTVSRGEVLGWSWLFSPYRWVFDARVLTPVEAIVLDGEMMRESISDDHPLGFEIMSRFARIIVGRLQATRLQLLDLYASRN